MRENKDSTKFEINIEETQFRPKHVRNPIKITQLSHPALGDVTTETQGPKPVLRFDLCLPVRRCFDIPARCYLTCPGFLVARYTPHSVDLGLVWYPTINCLIRGVTAEGHACPASAHTLPARLPHSDTLGVRTQSHRVRSTFVAGCRTTQRPLWRWCAGVGE